MKKQFLKNLAVLVFLLVPVIAHAKKFPVDEHVTSTGPGGITCYWHITGEIDVSLNPFNSNPINSYNITMKGNCGEYTFVGKVINAPGAGDYGGYNIRGRMQNLLADDEFFLITPEFFPILLSLHNILISKGITS